MSLFVSLKPRMSEKAYGQSTSRQTYVFAVPGDVNKQTVAAAVAEQFEVTVVKVNILNTDGKAKRTYSKSRGKYIKGVRSDVKKAYVTIAKGQNIPIFAAEEEAAAKEEKAEAKAEKKSKGNKS